MLSAHCPLWGMCLAALAKHLVAVCNYGVCECRLSVGDLWHKILYLVTAAHWSCTSHHDWDKVSIGLTLSELLQPVIENQSASSLLSWMWFVSVLSKTLLVSAQVTPCHSPCSQ